MSAVARIRRTVQRLGAARVQTTEHRVNLGAATPSALFVTSEMADFVKVGGLGEISAALPRSMRDHLDVRVLLPGYREVMSHADRISIVGRLPPLSDVPACNLGRLETLDGLVVYVLLCPDLYERDGSPYCDGRGFDWEDNDIRFARLSLAAAEFSRGSADPDWKPDILHLNDWPTALAPAYLSWLALPTPSILTIHNLAYQGLFPRECIRRLGIPEQAFQIDGVEFHGKLSFLKAGLFYASHLTTVSPTYAAEITTPELGCGLDGLIRTRAVEGRLTGILNGIDESWDPRTDHHLAGRFELNDWEGRKANAAHVRRVFDLVESQGPCSRSFRGSCIRRALIW